MIRRSSISTLFPYTTLFRSISLVAAPHGYPCCMYSVLSPESVHRTAPALMRSLSLGRLRVGPAFTVSRSEEHTSELQSHVNLVCRPLLEKKKFNLVFIDVLL